MPPPQPTSRSRRPSSGAGQALSLPKCLHSSLLTKEHRTGFIACSGPNGPPDASHQRPASAANFAVSSPSTLAAA